MWQGGGDEAWGVCCFVLIDVRFSLDVGHQQMVIYAWEKKGEEPDLSFSNYAFYDKIPPLVVQKIMDSLFTEPPILYPHFSLRSKCFYSVSVHKLSVAVLV